MSRLSRAKHLIALWVLTLMAGCVGLATRVERPMLSVASINLARASLFEQSYRVQLRIRNPNPFALPIDAIRYEMELNDRLFASGLSNERIVVPEFGSEVVEVEAISTLFGIVRQLDALGTGQDFDYRLRGKMYLADGSVLPFEHRGDVASSP